MESFGKADGSDKADGLDKPAGPGKADNPGKYDKLDAGSGKPDGPDLTRSTV